MTVTTEKERGKQVKKKSTQRGARMTSTTVRGDTAAGGGGGGRSVGKTLNVNVGILGHIDSGKTAIARALSSEASTSAFDKPRQSQERGITLELGFSAFSVDGCPSGGEYGRTQFTLVDCPGHATLVRTIIGGSRIMDAMLLVVDATKGMQAQTSEGLVIGALATRRLVVALNKVDLFAGGADDPAVHKMAARIAKVLAASATPFAGAAIVPVSAAPREGHGGSSGIEQLKAALLAVVDPGIVSRRHRSVGEPFLMAADHCFPIKGQGTVVTGTVLRGAVRVGDAVEVVELATTHKVKAIQVFHRPVDAAQQGDRIGVNLVGLDPASFERGIVAQPRSVPAARAVIGLVERIPYFKGDCASKSKWHGECCCACVGSHHHLSQRTISPSHTQ
jgi:selenocysteine-specific elongation factor